ncbi:MULTISPECIES: DUF4352 domain-containing protein [unclassified Rhodococcus (in: high G+C Gram-positive bacteria)]|uniref:DUF4352 domain-containing protein n=1 Tax=unclassified Rhodococcus (in: high G+C Gram-positive bacteria) TaxID=192944 RepID=UPI0015C5A569|nr:MULTISPECIES: hypothetical protein [unclassified Rhodococcus (in: high G+C Gram-positive bacteria)]
MSVDSLATAYLDEGIGYEQINPGNALDTTVVFDVPAGTVPAEIELHDSAFSGGTTVALRRSTRTALTFLAEPVSLVAVSAAT